MTSRSAPPRAWAQAAGRSSEEDFQLLIIHAATAWPSEPRAAAIARVLTRLAMRLRTDIGCLHVTPVLWNALNGWTLLAQLPPGTPRRWQSVFSLGELDELRKLAAVDCNAFVPLEPARGPAAGAVSATSARTHDGSVPD